jgi:hypothetical protein
MTNIPSIDIETAIRMYYENVEIGNNDIQRLFLGKVGSTRMQSLKRIAKDKMREKGTLIWNANKVNTEAAFEAWGLDITDLERRYQKLKKLGLA